MTEPEEEVPFQENTPICSTEVPGIIIKPEPVYDLPLDNACPYSDCKRTYKYPHTLKSHINSFHLKIRPFKCDKGCGKKFPTLYRFDMHTKICRGIAVQRPNKCTFPRCKARFAFGVSIKRHILQVHEKTAHNIKCTKCDYKCADKSSLKIHLETHKEVADIKCKLCEFVFRSRAELYSHIIRYHR